MAEPITYTTAQIMEQAQVFASAWSLVGGPFDSGNQLEAAEQEKAELAAMVDAHAAPQPTELPCEFTPELRRALLWLLWNHQGGKSQVGQPIRAMLGIGQHDHLTDEEIAEAKAYREQQPATAQLLAADQPDVEKCSPDIYTNGKSLGLFDIPKELAESFCTSASQMTGLRYDWHYIAGRVHIKVLMGDQQEGAKVPELTPELAGILGRPNFMCADIAQVLRAGGRKIERRAEAEQAAVIHWMLGFYLQHGIAWRDEAEADLKRTAGGAA